MREYMQYIDCNCATCETVHNEGNKKSPQVGFLVMVVLMHNPRFAEWYNSFYSSEDK